MVSFEEGSGSGKRSRLYSGTACDQCFRRKVRCTGQNPTCTRCARNGVPCTYSTRISSSHGKSNKSKLSEDQEAVADSGATDRNTDEIRPSKILHAKDVDVGAESLLRGVQTEEISMGQIGQPLQLNSSQPCDNAISLDIFPSTSLNSWILPAEAISQQPYLSSNSATTLTYIPSADTDPMPKAADFNVLGHLDTPKWSISPCSHSTGALKFPYSGNTGSNFRNLTDLTDRRSAEVVFGLYQYQLWEPESETPIATLFNYAQDGLSIVAKCLLGDDERPPHNNASSLSSSAAPAPVTVELSSPAPATLALAFTQILHQVFTCYVRLKSRVRLLDGTRDSDLVYIGDFRIQSPEPLKSVLAATIAQEMESCKAIIGRVIKWSQQLALAGNDDVAILAPFVGSLQALLRSDMQSPLSAQKHLGTSRIYNT